jgi:hypothetical protein
MRRPLDSYMTPEKAVMALRETLGHDFERHHRFFEPCVGTGNIIEACTKEIFGGPIIPKGNWKTLDIDPSAKPDYLGDATMHSTWAHLHATTGYKPEWTITNPPFNCAIDIVKNAVEFSTIGTCMLLRLSFLEPTFERGEWLKTNPPNKLIVLPRISFTNDGKTDSVTCGWMIWSRRLSKGGITIVSKGSK